MFDVHIGVLTCILKWQNHEDPKGAKIKNVHFHPLNILMTRSIHTQSYWQF